MSFFYILGSRLLLLIILLSLTKENKWLLWDLYFAKFSKENVLKLKFWNCYPLWNSITHSMIFFSNFCDKNWTCYRRNSHQSGQNSHSTLIFCNFLNRKHTQLPNLRHFQYVPNSLWKFQTNRTNRLFVKWIRVNRGQIYISLHSNAAWNLLIFVVLR